MDAISGKLSAYTTALTNITTKPAASPPSSSGSTLDTVNVSSKGLEVLGYVNQAQQLPEVRSDKVDQFQAAIHGGAYPSEAIVAGIIALIGGSIKSTLPTDV